MIILNPQFVQFAILTQQNGYFAIEITKTSTNGSIINIAQVLPKEHEHLQILIINANEERPALITYLIGFFDLKAAVKHVGSIQAESQVVVQSDAEVSERLQIVENDGHLVGIHL